ncbi:MAG: hypothetical protein WBM78_24715 [Desulfobacterales bacterium]
MAIIAFFKKLILRLAVAVCICGLNAQLFAADKPAQTTDTATASTASRQAKGKMSLIEAVPELYYTAKRSLGMFWMPDPSSRTRSGTGITIR